MITKEKSDYRYMKCVLIVAKDEHVRGDVTFSAFLCSLNFVSNAPLNP